MCSSAFTGSRDCGQECGWETRTDSCVFGEYTSKAEMAAGYGCPLVTDCVATCGDVIPGYAVTPERRVVQSLKYKLGRATKVADANECATKCNANTQCKSFELKVADRTNRCLLKTVSSRVSGINLQSKPTFSVYDACDTC